MIKHVLLELHPKEVALIVALRERWRYGDVVVVMRDGIPQRLSKVTEFDNLEPDTQLSAEEVVNL